MQTNKNVFLQLTVSQMLHLEGEDYSLMWMKAIVQTSH
jgi:hypothetical protein